MPNPPWSRDAEVELNTYAIGDCLEVLRTLPDACFNCCVTSPPYWGLRDYGHDRQLGLESTPEEYVARMVEVFGEVKRVLRDDGTLWLNLGDSYVSQGGVGQGRHWDGRGKNTETQTHRVTAGMAGLKTKDLVGIPWRVAFALQADGWYLRSDIIWSKPNPMPESVTDRPTKAHEYVFLLSKQARYWYDADAVREPWADCRNGYSGAKVDTVDASALRNDGGRTSAPTTAGRNRRSVWTVATKPFSGPRTVRQVRVAPDADVDGMKRTTSPDCPVHVGRAAQSRSARRDGRAASQQNHSPRSGDDHAPSLPLFAPVHGETHGRSASTSGSLPASRAPSATPHSTGSRRTDREPGTTLPCTPSAQSLRRTGDTSEAPASTEQHHGNGDRKTSGGGSSGAPESRSVRRSVDTSVELVSEPLDLSSCTCLCYTEEIEGVDHFAVFPPALIKPCILAGCPEGGIVLDPFFGSGTTGMVAESLGRSWFGIELNPEYEPLIKQRTAQRGML